MRRPEGESDDTPGGDSFLDIVANMVGILVLLVVIVGVRAARQVAIVEPVADAGAANRLEAEAEAETQAAVEARLAYEKSASQLSVTLTETALREQARLDLATYAAKLRQELDEERGKLAEGDQRTYDTTNELAQTRLRLEELNRRQVSLVAASAPDEVETIQFEPTPIVRERVREEVFVRLEGDRVVYLPLDELKLAVEQSIESIAGSGTPGPQPVRVERLVGPVGGFSLRCLFEKSIHRSDGGNVLVTRLALARLEPQPGVPTEPVADAPRQGSQLMNRLAPLNRSKTVVTIVAYPDSFDTLPAFERRLRDAGFRVATTVQKEGQAVTFSPGGRTTVMQ